MTRHNFPWGAALFFIGTIIFSLVVILFYQPDYVRGGQASGGAKSKAYERLNIVCSTGIIADMVATIGGEHVRVAHLMGPGVDPHMYRARASDMQLLAKAQLIFYHGLHLEGKMATLFERMNSGNGANYPVRAVAVADAVPKDLLALADDGVTYDPHVWHDVTLWQYAAERVYSALAEMDWAHATYYQQRFAEYKKELELLNNFIKKEIARIPENQRILITAHDAFGYFGRAYGFQVVGLQGISTDSEISMHDIQRVTDIIIEYGVPALFLESLIPERTLQAVSQAVQARGSTIIFGQELFSDALGDAAIDADTYVGMMRHNVRAIVGALESPLDRLASPAFALSSFGTGTAMHSGRTEGGCIGEEMAERILKKQKTEIGVQAIVGRQPDEAESEDRALT